MLGSAEDRGVPIDAPALERPGRTIVLIGGAIGVVVVIAIGLTLAIGSGGVRNYPADSPEGTVQRFLQAVDSHDYDSAYSLLSTSVRNRVSMSGFVSQYSYGSPSENRRIRIDRVDRSDRVTTVDLSVDSFSGGDLFGSSRYTYQVEIRLVREGGTWLIDEDFVGLY